MLKRCSTNLDPGFVIPILLLLVVLSLCRIVLVLLGVVGLLFFGLFP